MKLRPTYSFTVYCVLALALFCNSHKVMAQEDRYNPYERMGEYYDDGGEKEVYYGKLYTMELRAHSNDCERFFNENTDSVKHLLKKATTYLYSASDSAMHNKKIMKTYMTMFNKEGEEILAVEKDSNNKTTDSTITLYDAKYNKTHVTDYGLTDPGSRWLAVISEEIFIWNGKGNLIKDSTVARRNEMTRWNMKEFTTTAINYNYDDSDNVVYYSKIEDNDTTIITFTNDRAKRTLLEKTRRLGGTTYNYTTTDAAGNLIESTTISEDDTTHIKNTYDKKNNLISTRIYTNGKLTSSSDDVPQSDGGHVLTQQVISYDEDGAVCPENTKTVSVYNKDSLLVTETTTADKNGAPFITNTRHIYRKDGRRVVFDSSIVIKQGDLYSSMYIQLTFYKYDAKGNMLEEIQKGGGEYGQNSKTEMSYNPKGQLLEDDDYGACLDEPYSIMKYKYYPNDTITKETVEIRGDSRHYYYFGEDTRRLGDLEVTPTGVTKTEYEYEK